MSAIVISPFSNSDIRDWPLEHYVSLIRILLRRWPGTGLIRVIGTKNQVLRACEIVRSFNSNRVLNDCGRLSWPQVLSEIKSAACVIGNNSGIPHFSGFYGVPTVCVFSGSHQRLEWRPLGFSVALVSRSIGCSPCQRDHGQTSPFAKACLREIDPEIVADAAFAIMARTNASRASRDGSANTATQPGAAFRTHGGMSA